MSARFGSLIVRYGVAVVTVAVAIWLRLLLVPWVGVKAQFAFVLLAIIVTAWVGGSRPALLAVTIGTLASTYYLLTPRGSFSVNDPEEQVGLLIFIFAGVGVSLLAGSMHSARQRAESAMQSVERQAALINQVSDAVIVRSLDGVITFWNRGAERLYGFSREEALGKSCRALLKTELGAGIADFDETLERSGEWEGELTQTSRDGHRLWVESRMNVVREGDQTLVLLTNRDVTERHKAEEALRDTHDQLEQRVRERTSELASANELLSGSEDLLGKSEAKFRSYLEHAPVAVLVSDPQNRFVEYNAEAATLLGYDRTELATLSIPDLVPEQNIEEMRLALETLGRERAVQGEFPLRRCNGDLIWISLRAVLLDDGHSLAYLQDISERKQAEAELRAERDKFEKIVRTVPVVICSFRKRPDGSWCFPFANPSIERIYGFRADELEQDASDVVSRVHPDDLDRFVELVQASARDMAPWRAEYRALHPSLGERWVEGHAVPSEEPDGGILWQGYIADITERKRAELELRDRERLLGIVTGSARVGLVVVGSGYRYLFANEAYAELFGLDLDEIVGRRVPDCLSDGWSQIQPRLDRALAGESVAYELVLPPRSASQPTRSFSVFYEPTTDAGQAPTVVVVVVEITDRRLAEHETLHHQRRLEGIVNSAMDGIITVDEELRVVLMNTAAERMFGHRCDEFLGHPLDRLLPARFQSSHTDQMRTFARTGVSARTMGTFGAICGVRANGEEFPIEASISHVELESGKLLTVTCRDVTDRVRSAEATRLLESQLRQSQKMEAFGQLAGGVAHDFNNLLTIIAGYSDMLLRALPSDGPDRASVEEIRLAGKRAAALTRQLLAFSRQQVLEPKIIDLNGIIEDIERMLRRLIGEDVEFVTDLRPGIGPVKVDPGQIDQVIVNIVVNARDAMPQGGKIAIETSEAEIREGDSNLILDVDPGRYVVVSISDTGTGVTPEDLPRIFEPFFTTKGVARGTGLGLAVVHGIVRQSGGFIGVESEVGKGTTFNVYLPVVEDSGQSAAATDNATATHGSETVLLVEDEDSVRKLASIALREYGFRVLTASEGQEAIRVMAESPVEVDILVTDVVMPGMSGRELAELLVARYPTLKVLFVSGYTDDAVVRHGVMQADVAFLQKPFSPISLATRVREVLDQR